MRGLSLIELMVAMTIGLIITIAVVQIFSSSRSTYQLDEGLARLQENARFSMEFLTREIRPAGHMGCLRNVTPFNNVSAAAPFNFSIPIQGFEYSGTAPGNTYAYSGAVYPADSTALWNPALDITLILGSGAGGAMAGTDAIVVRHVNSAPVALVAPYNDPTQVFLSPGGSNSFTVGQTALISNCEKASLFKITDKTGDILAHDGTENFCSTWTAGAANCPTDEQQYGPDSEVAQAQTFAFYIANGTNNVPSLWQATLTGPPAELVEGVENMQIMYGVDSATAVGTNSSGQPNQYLTASAVTTGGLWGRVISVRISLLLSTVNTTGQAGGPTLDANATYLLAGSDAANGVTINPPDDRRRRRVFETTILLRNRGV